ncbi:MAG: alpha/beta hydrolase [Pseudomonadota bacterium]
MKPIFILVALLIGIPLGYLGISNGLAAQREAATLRAYPAEGVFVSVDGAKVHAVIEGSGPNVVLIHGAGGNARDFTFSFSSALADRGYRVIAFDRPGFGHSDAIAEDPSSLALQAERLVKAAEGLGADKPIVLGHSLGGAVAMAWVTEHPENIAGLLALSGVSHTWPGDTAWLYRSTNSFWGRVFMVPGLAAFISQDYIASVISGAYAPQRAPEGYAAHVGAGLTIRRQSLKVNAAERVALKPNVEAMVSAYSAISVPVIAIHGDADMTVSDQLHSIPLAQTVQNGEYINLPGIGHMPHHTNESDIIEGIERLAKRAGLK